MYGLGTMGPFFDCAGNPSAVASQTDPTTGSCVDLPPAIQTPSSLPGASAPTDAYDFGSAAAIAKSITDSTPTVFNPMGSPTAQSQQNWLIGGGIALAVLLILLPGGRQ